MSEIKIMSAKLNSSNTFNVGVQLPEKEAKPKKNKERVKK